jgi:hypothetical protein
VGSDFLKESVNGIKLSGKRERLEDGLVGEGVVREAGLLRGPVEETESE